MIGATEINRTFDLLAFAERDTNVRKSGVWYSGPCPFCGGEDRFVLKQTGEGWRWFCRGCGEGKYRTPLDYIMQREGISFQGALAWAGGGLVQGSKTRKPKEQQQRPKASFNEATPCDAWRARALAFVEACESSLWIGTGTRALDYLHRRGLKDETLRRYRIGYNPADEFEQLEDWGLPDPEDGNRNAVWLPRGVVIPCFASGQLWYVKFRRPLTQEQERTGEQKYIKVRGSKAGIFGADNLRGSWLAVLTEGEFDAMLLDQEAGDLAGIATLGSATDRISRLDITIWASYLLPVAHILAAYDQDQEGEKGIRALEAFTERVHHAPLPEIQGVNDVTDLWKAGGDLGEWLARTVERLGLLPVGVPKDLADQMLAQAEKAAESSDFPRFARLFAAGAKIAGAVDPYIPWDEWIIEFESQAVYA